MKPFKRNARPFTDGHYMNDGKGQYLRKVAFAEDGRRYIRAALLLQRDLLTVFEFVEPDQKNFNCFSIRIHELIVRTCIEIEANFKAILRENNYKKGGNWNIDDYRKIELTHRLSEYRVKIPDFVDQNFCFDPFQDWVNKPNPEWHYIYNFAKHDRHKEFASANFGTLLNAIGGLFILLASQFHTDDLSTGSDFLTLESGANDGFEPVAGGLFRVEFPKSWPDSERYEFQHSDISDDTSFFQSIEYV